MASCGCSKPSRFRLLHWRPGSCSRPKLLASSRRRATGGPTTLWRQPCSLGLSLWYVNGSGGRVGRVLCSWLLHQFRVVEDHQLHAQLRVVTVTTASVPAVRSTRIVSHFQASQGIHSTSLLCSPTQLLPDRMKHDSAGLLQKGCEALGPLPWSIACLDKPLAKIPLAQCVDEGRDKCSVSVMEKRRI